jgi:hypothetical protein
MDFTDLNGACAVCHRVLDWVVERDGSNGRWVHTFQDRQHEDHQPVWMPENPETEYRCDFCNVNGPTFVLPCSDFPYPIPGAISTGEWLACGTCGELISQGKWNELVERAITISPSVAYQIREGLMNRQQSRELITKIYRLVRQHVIGPLEPWVPTKGGDDARN